MIRLIGFLFLVAILAVIAVWFVDHPGHVTLQWMDYRVEMTTAVAAVLLLGLIIVSALLYRLWHWVKRGPQALSEAWQGGKRKRGVKALSRGYAALASGDGKTALARAHEAAGLLNEPALTNLLAAQAAQLAGEDTEAEARYEALRADPLTEIAALRGLLARALRNGDRDEALRLARRARDLKPEAGWVSSVLLEFLPQKQAWNEAETVLTAAVRHDHMPRDKADHMRAALRFAEALDAAAKGEDKQARSLAVEAHRLDRAFVPAAAFAARAWGEEGSPKKAFAILKSTWAVAPHPELVRVFGDLTANDPPFSVLKRLQELVADRRYDRESRLALAERAIDANDWDLARQELRALADDKLTPRVCNLYAALEEGESGDRDAARDWRRRAEAAAPDPTWHCRACGRTATAWRPICPSCGCFDTADWRAPEDAAAATEPTPAVIRRAQRRLPISLVDVTEDLYRDLAEGEAADAESTFNAGETSTG
jgi:HemY protein